MLEHEEEPVATKTAEHPIQTHFAGMVPQKDGNYYVIDLMTTSQWVAKVFSMPDKTRMVLCGNDNGLHKLDEYNHPSLRWVEILPLTKDKMDRYLTA